MSDFQLQISPEKLKIYRDGPGIWYSDEIRRWIVVSPSLIRQIMGNRALSVPSYIAGTLGSRLGHDFGQLDKIVGYLPLAFEGERHKVLRADFARAISRNTPSALAAFVRKLDERLDECLGRGKFCLVSDVLAPVLRAMQGELIGIDIPDDVAIEDIPQMFDDVISGRRRLSIQETTVKLQQASQLPSLEETYFASAILSLSANTLMGSLARSCIAQLKAASKKQLCDIEWSEEFSHTALALVEKKAVMDVVIGDAEIKKGDRLRLILDAAGYEQGGDEPVYSDLYFAVGLHRCVGMSLSRQCWSLLTTRLSQERLVLKVLDVDHRQGDYVFIFPKRCDVEVVN
jgi:cytochrome P450